MLTDEEAARLAGATLVSADGQELGDVEEVLTHAADNRAAWVASRIDGRLVVVPLDGASAEEDRLTVRYVADQVRAAPELAGDRLDARATDALFEHYRTLHARGVRFAMLTNNVREWEPLWRAKLPVDEIFETVVDSAFVGMRKPDPAIYAIVLERLRRPAAACVFVDDIAVNVETARELGFAAVGFRDTDQAIAELDALLISAASG